MNDIVNKFLLAGDKFMNAMHLKQPCFTYSAYGPFTKNKKRIQNLYKYIYRNELDKASFQHDMVYGDFKDLSRKKASDKLLKDKAFNIAKDTKYDGHAKVLLQWFIKVLIKRLKLVMLNLCHKINN